MRQALYPSGAKDDPRDADLLLDILLQHCDKLRRLVPDTEATRRVQNLVEERRKLVDEKTEQSNRLTSHLKIYFPQMLDWFEQLDTELVCTLLLRSPTLETRAVAKSAAGTAANVFPQAPLSGSRTDRAPHSGDSSGHSRHWGSSGD
jgi:transposase